MSNLSSGWPKSASMWEFQGGKRTAEQVIAALEAAPVEQRGVWGGSSPHRVVPVETVSEAIALLRAHLDSEGAR